LSKNLLEKISVNLLIAAIKNFHSKWAATTQGFHRDRR